MRRLHSLRVRLVLWTVALEAVLLVILAAVLLLVVNQLQQRQINETLRLGATQLNAVIDVQGNDYLVEAGDIAALRREGVLAWVLTADGVVVQTVGDVATLAVPTDLPDFGQFRDATLSDGTAARLLVAHLQENGQEFGVLVLALPLRNAQRIGRLLLWSLALAIPIVLLLSAMGGFFLAGRALAPVSTITATANQISAADLSQRLELDLPYDEIGQLAHTFNAMLARLDRAFQRERQLTADVSHELRTPLAMLKTQLSLARSRPRDAATLLTMMDEMEGDVDRMARLIEQMLTLTAIEQEQQLALSPVDLAPLLQRLMTQLEPVAAAKSVVLQDNLDPALPLFVMGDQDRLHQLFTNLLDNAIKY
ncbi:MAG: HAMP domain-containing protein, partial [Caldilineaceae bacterium]|nr:HAMP domain-containing protein [Caldilineaceae bacterium]